MSAEVDESQLRSSSSNRVNKRTELCESPLISNFEIVDLIRPTIMKGEETIRASSEDQTVGQLGRLK